MQDKSTSYLQLDPKQTAQNVRGEVNIIDSQDGTDLASAYRTMVGKNGVDIYADTDTHTGTWAAFVVLADVVINAVTDDGNDASTIPTATTLPAGTFATANGTFTSIDLTSGTILMIRE